MNTLQFAKWKARFRELETLIENYVDEKPSKNASGATYTPIEKANMIVERQALAFAIAREVSRGS